MNEMKSLTLNGKTYNSFPDQQAREAVNAVVRFNEQTLTPEQQAQARKNIGAMPEGAEISLSTKQINALDALFKAASYTEDVSAAYANFCEAFGLVNPDIQDRSYAVLIHRYAYKLNDSVGAVASGVAPGLLMVYASEMNSRRLAFHNGSWVVSEYSPIPIPEGAVSATFSIPDGMCCQMVFYGEREGDDTLTTHLGDTGWVDDNGSSVDVADYNDGKHYCCANFKYVDGREIAEDFDTDSIDIYFVDANGNRMS